MTEHNIEVDKNDNIIGLRPRDDFYTGKYIHRSVQLILFNSKNEILIQKRAPNKKWYPNLYDSSVSGTVADESYDECLKKETKEEIGIEVDAKFLFNYPFFDEKDKAFHAVYFGKSDEAIKYNEKEATKIKWVKADELKKDINENPQKYTPPFVAGMKIYFEKFYKQTT